MGSQAILIADLGYGDAGKGGLIDHLTRTTGAHTVVRYNGGAQAAHNVVTPDGRQHTFAQFGSGTLVPGTRTYLSRFMLLDPLAMLAEARALVSLGIDEALSHVAIDRRALVTTPFHAAANRIKELARGDGRHGSCGMGIGETMADWLAYGPQVPAAGDLEDGQTLVRKLSFLRDAKLAQLEEVLDRHAESEAIQAEARIFHDQEFIPATIELYLHFAARVALVDETFLRDLCAQPGKLLFEGAQGVLLDEWHGFYPYSTWSTTTFQNAETLLEEGKFSGDKFRLGLTRAYATRHGAGPFVSESKALTQQLPDRHNGHNPWQRAFRVGHLDLLALRYALAVAGPIDGLAVTNLDRLGELPAWYTCKRYRTNGYAGDLSDFFLKDAQGITAIRPPRDPQDLSQQARLTALLFELEPLLIPWEGGLGAYAEFIAEALNAQLTLTSYGPTTREKQVLGGLLNVV
jgi:adenylosuccinate synthase